MAKVSDLPNELLRNLFLMISLKDRKMAALVSRRWRKIAEDPVLWKLCIIYIRNRHDIKKLYHRRIHHIQEIEVCHIWSNKVRGDEWKTKHLEKLLEATLELPKLKKVGLWGIDLRSVNSELLARALAKLEELSLVGKWKSSSHELTTNTQRLAIINEIPKYRCLKKLSLVKFNLGTLELEAELLEKVISGLDELNLQRVSFTNGQIQEIFKSILENNKLAKVEFSWLKLSSVEPELLGIALTGIESVSLQKTKFSPHQLSSLFTKLGQNTKIKTFHSVENDFSAAEPRLFARGLSKLEEVMFCVNNLTDDQVQALFIELKENCKLKSLDIDSDDLSSVDADDLAAAVDNIEALGLVYTQLTTEQITAILRRAQQNTNLKELNLGDNCMCGVDPALVTAVKEMLGNGLKIVQSDIKSEIELPGAPVTATLSEAEVSVESSPVCSPVIPTVADFKRPFHGWSRETEPRCGLPWVEQDYSGYDMRTPFTLNPILTISIGGGKKAKSPGEKVKRPSKVSAESDEGPSPSKASKLEKKMESTSPSKSIPKSPEKKAELTTPVKNIMPSIYDLKREKKKSKNPNLKFHRPLEVGWVREIVFRDEKNSNKADVFYWPPVVDGVKHKKYKSANELEGYLITSGSMYALSFFTFKKEAIGAPEGQEIVRYSTGTPKSAEKSKKMKDKEESGHPEGLGKRVSKPPEKLLLEIEKAPVSKERTSSSSREKPPSSREKSGTPKEKPSTPKEIAPVQKPSDLVETKTPKNSKESAKAAESPPKSASSILKSQLPTGKGLLKVKMFGKMMARNQMTGSNSEAEEDKNEDMPFLDSNRPQPIEKNPLPDQLASRLPASSMTVTKVKKPIISTPQGISIRPASQISQVPVQPSLTIRPAVEIRPVERTPASHMQVRMVPNQGAPRIMPGHAPHAPQPLGPIIPGVDLDVGPGPKIVRPTKSTQLPCSIHCPGVSGFPSLSCTSCHCLFHPKCVGLPGHLGHSSQFQFFCNDCHNKARETDQQPPRTSPPSQLIPPPKQKSPRTQQEQSPRANTKNIAAPPSNKPQQQEARSALKENNRIEKPPSVPRPIEAQTMVNIGGHKFLVIPHPAPVVMDSPPPSPPPTVRGIKPVEKKSGKKQKLPVLLSPGPNTPLDVPSFEVEQAPDGTLQLIPVGNALDKNPFGPLARTRKSETGGAEVKSWCSDFTNNLSSGYFAMMHVFKYLTVKERLLAAKVCRLWWNITYHASLWDMVSLKNTRVYDWRGFGQFLNKTKSANLDLRKLLFVKDRDATWAELIYTAADLVHLTKLQLPRLSGSILTELVTTCPRLEVVHAPLTSSPVDLSQFAKMSHLRELRLKAGIGILKVENGTKDLDKLASTLTHLSLLTLDGLSGSDFDVFGALVHLETLELGDCSQAPSSIFTTLSQLPKLERLRLEKGSVGREIEKLAGLEKLRVIELIDFQVELGFQEGVKTLAQVKKLLLIPTYRDEVAAVNAEIVDGITKDMRHLTVFCLGVTNEWLEAMAAAVGGGKKATQEKDCFPIVRGGKADLISLPALYRLMCREMPKTKVKVLKMSAQATCKQFISILEAKG